MTPPTLSTRLGDEVHELIEAHRQDAEGFSHPDTAVVADLLGTFQVECADQMILDGGIDMEVTDRIVGLVRKGFQDELRGCVDRIVHEEVDWVFYGTDDKEGGDRTPPEPGVERRAAFKEYLRECLDVSFERFWAVLEALVRIPPEIDSDDPLDFLARNEDLAISFLQVIQEHEDTDRMFVRVEEACQRHDLERPPFTNFRGASVPTPIPLFEKFCFVAEFQSHFLR